MQRKILGAVAAGTLMFGLTACGSDSENPPQASAPPAPATSSASPSPSATPSPSKKASSGDLEDIVMKQSDISRTELTLDSDGIEPAPKADDLATPTFDYCGGTFDTEGSRSERYAVVAGFTKPQNGAVFNEVVRYSSAEEAEKALEEFRTAVRDCNGGSFPSIINDGDDVTFESSPDLTSAQNLNYENAIALSDVTVSGQKIRLSQFVIQVDDALDITYAATQGASDSDVEKAIGTIGALVSQRL